MASWRYTQELIYRNHGPLLITAAEQVASGSSVRTKRKPLVDCYRPVCAVDVTRPHTARYVYDPWNSYFVLKAISQSNDKHFWYITEVERFILGFISRMEILCLSCSHMYEYITTKYLSVCPVLFLQTVSQREKR